VLLEEVIGQERATTVIRRAVAAGRVAHAYLFEGPRGVGKHAAAIGLAMLLNCQRVSEHPSGVGADADAGGVAGVACGSCEPCRRIAAGLHPDVVTVSATTALIVMEQAQEIVTLVKRGPHEGRARVIIIDDADRMNASASNGLLKTLEEPGPRTHLILLTAAPERLLATIRSRTQRIRFRSISAADLLSLAALRGLDAGRAQVASVLADGRVGRFLELMRAADAEEIPDRPPTADETRAIVAQMRVAATSRGTVPAFDTAAALGDKESKAYLPDALAVLARVYRDAIAIGAGARELALFTPDTTTDIDLPLGLPVAALTRALDVIVEAETALAGNVNAVMAMERLLIHLHRVERGDGRATT
jgi:DNA polymerase-3 subunit delta'